MWFILSASINWFLLLFIQDLEVYAGDVYLGKIKENWSLWHPEFDIIDDRGNVVFQISGSFFRCWGTQGYKVYRRGEPSSGIHVGHVGRYSGSTSCSLTVNRQLEISTRTRAPFVSLRFTVESLLIYPEHHPQQLSKNVYTVFVRWLTRCLPAVPLVSRLAICSTFPSRSNVSHCVCADTSTRVPCFGDYHMED